MPDADIDKIGPFHFIEPFGWVHYTHPELFWRAMKPLIDEDSARGFY